MEYFQNLGGILTDHAWYARQRNNINARKKRRSEEAECEVMEQLCHSQKMRKF